MKMSKAKRIKLIMGIIIPVLVMTATIIMVSISFAWFANITRPTVQSIDLLTQKAFILTFDSSADSGDRNIKYKGQTSIVNSDGGVKLVTQYNGQSDGLSGSMLQQFMLDSPYYFITTIALDTETSSIDMNMTIDSVQITSGESMLDDFTGNKAGDVPFAFTWYFKEHVDGSVNYLGTGVDDENAVMDYRLPEEDEVWYTPYGQLTFAHTSDGAVSTVKAVNGEAVGADYSILESGLQDMRIQASHKSFDFYIVFAPQKLFWAQFCAADRDKSLADLYAQDELVKIYGATNSKPQMFYSNMSYFNSVFEFGATINVTQIYPPQTQTD